MYIIMIIEFMQDDIAWYVKASFGGQAAGVIYDFGYIIWMCMREIRGLNNLK